MIRRRLLQGSLLLTHAALGALVLSAVVRSHLERAEEVAELRTVASEEEQRTTALRDQVEVQEATLAGLREGDPYAVELVARTRLGWPGGPDEVRPPPVVSGAE